MARKQREVRFSREPAPPRTAQERAFQLAAWEWLWRRLTTPPATTERTTDNGEAA